MWCPHHHFQAGSRGSSTSAELAAGLARGEPGCSLALSRLQAATSDVRDRNGDTGALALTTRPEACLLGPARPTRTVLSHGKLCRTLLQRWCTWTVLEVAAMQKFRTQQGSFIALMKAVTSEASR